MRQQVKDQSQKTPARSTTRTPARSAFQTRPFVVQAKSDDSSSSEHEQSGLERYLQRRSARLSSLGSNEIVQRMEDTDGFETVKRNKNKKAKRGPSPTIKINHLLCVNGQAPKQGGAGNNRYIVESVGSVTHQGDSYNTHLTYFNKSKSDEVKLNDWRTTLSSNELHLTVEIKDSKKDANDPSKNSSVFLKDKDGWYYRKQNGRGKFDKDDKGIANSEIAKGLFKLGEKVERQIKENVKAASRVRV